MKLTYLLKGAFDFQSVIVSEKLIMGVDSNDNDPYEIPNPTLEQTKEMLNKSQYIGTGMTATLVEISTIDC